MERLEALKELEAAVMADKRPWREAGDADGKFSEFEAHHALNAFDGSLDAAKALHEAMLPGWDIQLTTYDDVNFEASVSEPLAVKTFDGISIVMSRAWLLAIIRAALAMEGE
ncbi:MAG: hypothetical protein ACE37E_01020 [Hyphomicrobiales bacterium]